MDSSKWYIKLGNLGFNLVALNILWVCTSLLGGIIVGIFPATSALFSVLKQLIIKDEDLPLVKNFFIEFKKDFIKSNILGYLITIIGFILYMDFRVLQILNHELLQLTLFTLTAVITFMYILITLYIFPVFVHFDLKFWHYPKYALILAIGKPFHTLIMGAGLAVILFLYINFPVLIIIFGISLISYVIMKVASYSLPKKQTTDNIV